MSPTSDVRVFGQFTQDIPASNEYLTLQFSPSSAPRKRRWSNYGLSADFLGDYFAAFFPGDTIPDSKINRKDTIKATVSFIANELLENAVKYNEDETGYPVTISLYLYEDEIIFCVNNHASREVAETYQAFIQELLSTNLDEVYTRQLERTAMGDGSSCMGVLTMMYDYSARFGWKFQPLAENPEIFQVCVIAYLSV